MSENVYNDPNIIAMKAVYDKALEKLMSIYVPLTIQLPFKRLQGMSSSIAQQASKETVLSEEISIRIFGLAHESDGSVYYLAEVRADGLVLFNSVIKHYELPAILTEALSIVRSIGVV